MAVAGRSWSFTACGVAYEVVPGVTSAVAVPAYCGIPVTHRDFCSSVHIITGHKRQGKPLELPFRALAETGGTLVFLMGLTALPEICQGLLEAGLPPETPAAVLEKGATAEQRTLVADLETLLAGRRRPGCRPLPSLWWVACAPAGRSLPGGKSCPFSAAGQW